MNENTTDETVTLSVKAFKLILQTAVVVAIGGTSGFAGWRFAGVTDPNSVAALQAQIVKLKEEIATNSNARKDPFTGTEGQELKDKLRELDARQRIILERQTEVITKLYYIQREHDSLLNKNGHIHGDGQ